MALPPCVVPHHATPQITKAVIDNDHRLLLDGS